MEITNIEKINHYGSLAGNGLSVIPRLQIHYPQCPFKRNRLRYNQNQC